MIPTSCCTRWQGTLRPGERKLLTADRWGISAIVLWEIAKLAQLGRLAIALEDPEVARVLARVHVWPITREIAHASTRLDVRGDPADELIAATSLVHNVPLVTPGRRSPQVETDPAYALGEPRDV